MEFNEQAIREAMRMAQSPQGQQLMKLLQSKSEDKLDAAMQQASGGNLTGARQLLSLLQEDPKARELLQQLGEHHG